MANILNIIVTLFGVVFIATLISAIIQVAFDYFDVERKSNKEINILIIVISIFIVFAMIISDGTKEERDEQIIDCIKSSDTIEELKETLIEKGIFEKI